MLARKCDVCGAYYKSYNMSNSEIKTNGLMFLNIDEANQYYKHEPIDCCPECMTAIRGYMDILRESRRMKNESISE